MTMYQTPAMEGSPEFVYCPVNTMPPSDGWQPVEPDRLAAEAQERADRALEEVIQQEAHMLGAAALADTYDQPPLGAA